ncbi:3-hydroxyisobutyryl-CoA hydrolase [Zhihengliuella salsuginis]|uniref:3-hydroxyisobutyryl-CoA hydrolase n=1 Tax=Zhihengliuella salsuginis TaxID=578222 RepID=A0ABQ3GHC3_9MICC|nr:3-hydroxyisobutyryl-CoA hydrolase [Zhihengliuella salsuginis]GHD06686.1 3-hydroxyisobutyryl-CoA hydrolase [Zhihengliuella salsuginis]
MTDTEERIIAQVADGLGIITLNRPEKINALTEAMVDAIGRTLDAWLDDDGVRIVVLHGAGGRGFCAGGDIKVFYEAITANRHGDFLRFLSREFEVDQQIATYPKPVVAFMDGLCMGGGVGLASHAGVRIVTPRSAVGMPEAKIGYSPDVGGTHLLGRAPGRIGEHLAATGAAMGAGDAIDAGFADFCMAEDGFDDLLATLHDLAGDAVASAAGAGPQADTVRAALEVLLSVPAPRETRTLLAAQPWIDAAYGQESLPVILAALDAVPYPAAREAAAAVRANSPLSVETALAAVRAARAEDFLPEAFTRELRIADFLMNYPDLPEGIRAQVIDKDRSPAWFAEELGARERAAIAEVVAQDSVTLDE